VLNESSRGSTIEAVVSRMKSLSMVELDANEDSHHQPKSRIRFIAISAT
jgi:hypothetical protein